MARDEVIIQLINQRFDGVEKRLDVMDAKNDQRDLRVNTMDANNKAEINNLKGEIDRLKTTWKVVCAIFTGAIGFLGWAVSQGIHLWDATHKG